MATASLINATSWLYILSETADTIVPLLRYSQAATATTADRGLASFALLYFIRVPHRMHTAVSSCGPLLPDVPWSVCLLDDATVSPTKADDPIPI